MSPLSENSSRIDQPVNVYPSARITVIFPPIFFFLFLFIIILIAVVITSIVIIIVQDIVVAANHFPRQDKLETR